MKRKKFSNRGVTLVELVIALAVLSMLLVAVIMMMSNNSVIYRKTKADINVQTVAQETLDSLQDSLMQAQVVRLTGFTMTKTTTKNEEGKEEIKYSFGSSVTYKRRARDPKLIASKDPDEHIPAEPAPYNDLSIYPFVAGPYFEDFEPSTDPNKEVVICPEVLEIVYSTDNTTNLMNNTCTVTYYFRRDMSTEMKDVVGLYVTRDYSDDSHSESRWDSSIGWKPSDSSEPSKEQLDEAKKYLYTDALKQAYFLFDWEAQSFNIKLSFSDRGMKYETSAVVGIRNSYVLYPMRMRVADDAYLIEKAKKKSEE